MSVEYLNTHQMGGIKRPHIKSQISSKKKNKISSSNLSMTKANSSTSKINEEKLELVGLDAVDDDNVLTLEQRLEALSKNLLEIEDRNGEDNDAPLSTGNESVDLLVNTSDSMVVLLEQALQAGDDASLEQCLSCVDDSIIEATTLRLPSGKVIQFLKKLVFKFERRPSRGMILTKWLAGILKNHNSFLISIPDLASQLSGLSNILEQRLASYSLLVSLGGRLDLLMSQISNEGSRPSGADAFPSSAQVFVEE